MQGIQFVTDEAGNRKAVLISLDLLGNIWEDIYDVLISESRKGEAVTEWEQVKAELAQ